MQIFIDYARNPQSSLIQEVCGVGGGDHIAIDFPKKNVQGYRENSSLEP